MQVIFIDKEMQPENPRQISHFAIAETDQEQKPIFHKLENIADMAALTPEERDFYQISLDFFRTNMAVMEHERNDGRAEGRAEESAKGLAEGEKAKSHCRQLKADERAYQNHHAGNRIK